MYKIMELFAIKYIIDENKLISTQATQDVYLQFIYRPTFKVDINLYPLIENIKISKNYEVFFSEKDKNNIINLKEA